MRPALLRDRPYRYSSQPYFLEMIIDLWKLADYTIKLSMEDCHEELAVLYFRIARSCALRLGHGVLVMQTYMAVYLVVSISTAYARA